MMNKCVKCGKEAICAKPYFIGSKDMIGYVKLEGAAVVGVCGECAKTYFKKQSNKNLLYAVGAFISCLFMLLGIVTNNFGSGATSSVNTISFIAIMITFLGSSIKFFIAYMAAMKKSSVDDIMVTEEMIDYEIIVRVLKSVGKINGNVIFNWGALSARRGVTNDYSNPAFVAEIRAPFNIGTSGKIQSSGIPDFSAKYPDGYMDIFIDKSLDKEGKELIRQAVEYYQKETNKQ